MTRNHTVSHRIGEIPVTISFSYYAGREGSMYKRNGDPGDPPEDAEIEILSIEYSGIDHMDMFSAGALATLETYLYELMADGDDDWSEYIDD
jgi:hypothetical protein